MKLLGHYTKKLDEIENACYKRVNLISDINTLEINDILSKIESENVSYQKNTNNNIMSEIVDMKKMGLYNGKLIHSERHIQNVMLFSSIIAKEQGLNDEDMMLLIESAKFHDCGRNSDYDRNHAEPSAKLASEMLAGKYNESNLKIIQIAIEYHEARESKKGEIDEKILSDLVLKYNLNSNEVERTKQICTILKDADALDRTRFVARGSLDADYLHTESAGKLINFAERINEEYAKNDLVEFCIEHDGVLNSVNRYMKNTGKNYRQIIRDIRKGHFKPTIDDTCVLKQLKVNYEETSIQNLAECENEIINLAQVIEKKKKTKMSSNTEFDILDQ